MADYTVLERADVVQQIVDTDDEIKKELEKEKIDEEKVFKLRYRQMIQGLYLQDVNNNK